MRRSSIRIITAISCLLFGAAAWRVGSYSDFSAQAQTPQAAVTSNGSSGSSAKLQPASASGPSASISTSQPAPGTEIYTAKRGEFITTVAHHYLGQTSYLTSSELAAAIREANKKTDVSNVLKANENIVIPGILPAPIVEKTIPVPKDFEVRAIYLTGVMAASDHGIRIVKHWREVGGNAVVFDIKDSDGSVNIPFDHPLLGEHKVYIHDVPKFVHFLHSQNMHAIARIAIFRDERLVKEHPELAVQSKKNHAAWRENGKLVWTDSSNPIVQDYNIALAKHVAQLGADEIQFDYVRFPAEGDQADASFVFQKENQKTEETASSNADKSCSVDSTSQKSSKQKKAACAGPHTMQRSDVITAFLKKAYAQLHPTGVLLSLDVFGVMAWQRPVDLSHTGQDIVNMAKYCDVLSPMIYPSHFFGMDGIEHPGDAPEHFIGESMARFELITHPNGDKTSGAVIRPWLQAFHWRTKTYSSEYIKVQVATSKEKGGIGFLFWNAANDYSKPYEAMPEMRAAKEKDKYLRGDELPTSTQAALSVPR